MENTKKLIIQYMKENKIESNYLFQNKKHQPMNETFIRDIMRSKNKKINTTCF